MDEILRWTIFCIGAIPGTIILIVSTLVSIGIILWWCIPDEWTVLTIIRVALSPVFIALVVLVLIMIIASVTLWGDFLRESLNISKSNWW